MTDIDTKSEVLEWKIVRSRYHMLLELVRQDKIPYAEAAHFYLLKSDIAEWDEVIKTRVLKPSVSDMATAASLRYIERSQKLGYELVHLHHQFSHVERGFILVPTGPKPDRFSTTKRKTLDSSQMRVHKKKLVQSHTKLMVEYKDVLFERRKLSPNDLKFLNFRKKGRYGWIAGLVDLNAVYVDSTERRFEHIIKFLKEQIDLLTAFIENIQSSKPA